MITVCKQGLKYQIYFPFIDPEIEDEEEWQRNQTIDNEVQVG